MVDKKEKYSVRRLQITGEGRVFVAITIGVGLAAINTGNNLLYLLLGWLLSVIIASGVLSELALRRLRIHRQVRGRVYANLPFIVEITVKNHKRHFSSYSIDATEVSSANPLDKSCYFLKIAAQSSQRMQYRHSVSHRGLYPFDGVRLTTTFPFSLFRKSRYIQAPCEIVVFPAVYPVPPPSPRSRKLGDTLLAQMGRRGEFFGLREYRDGDDRRDIHWRSSARAGRFMVREFEQEAHKRATIVLDNALPDTRLQDALEDAISLAASLCKTYLELGYAVQLITRSCHIPRALGPAQQMRILKSLALLETTGEEAPFTAAIDPHCNSVLVAPRGVQAKGRPTHTSFVLEAS